MTTLQSNKKESFVGTLVSLVMFIPLTLLRAFVITKLWGWFIVPLGVAGIGVAHAFGIGTILTFIMVGLNEEIIPIKQHLGIQQKLSDRGCNSVAISLVVWLFGFIAHSFM